MASQAQINANRKNALKSTGPRTKEGKETVSQNAVKHGLCANRNVIKSESQEEYNMFKDEMIADLAPIGAMEYMLADRIVCLSWRLKRAEFFQNMVIDALMDYEMALCRSFLRNALREAEAGNPELLMGHVINKDFSNSRTLDLLLRYERRIESYMYKAIAEFRKMQKMRKAKHPSSSKDFAGTKSQNTGFEPEIPGSKPETLNNAENPELESHRHTPMADEAATHKQECRIQEIEDGLLINKDGSLDLVSETSIEQDAGSTKDEVLFAKQTQFNRSEFCE
jgi:hypothetical protein